MKHALLIITGLAIFTACNKPKVNDSEIVGQCGNTCILDKISQFGQSPDICTGSATVKQYTFQNQDVYVFDQGTCGNDFAQAVLNENCDTLGFLGGIAGNTQISGQNFYDNSIYINTIWNN